MNVRLREMLDEHACYNCQSYLGSDRSAKDETYEERRIKKYGRTTKLDKRSKFVRDLYTKEENLKMENDRLETILNEYICDMCRISKESNDGFYEWHTHRNN